MAIQASLQAVADAADVSVPTASLVLNGKGQRYAEATRQRVLSAAQRLGYRPGAAARATAQGRQGAVCLLRASDPRFSYLPGDLLNGIEEALMATDHHLVIARSETTSATGELGPKWARQILADGFLVDNQETDITALQKQIQAGGQPAIWINVDHPRDAVRPDDEGAGFQATTLLIEHGHRRIAAADFSMGRGQISQHYSQQARLAGYKRAMRGAGLPAQILQEAAPVSGAQRLAVAQRWLVAPDRPTAVVAWTNTAAGPCLAAALALGLRIPADISVITITERPQYECGLPVAAIILPWSTIGTIAVELLLARCAGGSPCPTRLLPCIPMPGATVGPVPE